jgi:hypothetical protein
MDVQLAKENNADCLKLPLRRMARMKIFNWIHLKLKRKRIFEMLLFNAKYSWNAGEKKSALV